MCALTHGRPCVCIGFPPLVYDTMFGGDDWEFEANQECFANLELYSPMKDLAQNCDGIDIPRMNHTPSKSVCSKNEL